MILQVSYLPVYRAHAVVPIAAGIAWGVQIVVPQAIRYLGTEIAISALVKGVQASNAYYSATAKISNANYAKYFRSKAALGVAAFTGAAAALGWALTNDGTLMQPEYPDSDGGYVEGYVYGSCGSLCPKSYYESLRSLASDFQSYGLIDVPNKRFEIQPIENYWRVTFYGEHNGNPDKVLSTKNYFQYSCEDGALRDLLSCTEPDTSVPSNELTDEDIFTGVSSYVSGLAQSAQNEFFGSLDTSDDGGKGLLLDNELTGSDGFVIDEDGQQPQYAPVMPDGSNLPSVGDVEWAYAHNIATGVGQSDDSSLPSYVPPEYWDNADYLANTIANGDSYLTGLNSGVYTPSVPDEGPGVTNPTVDLSGIESRLDTGNSLSESVLTEVQQLNSTTFSTQSAPNSSKSFSFWDIRYPDGIGGVVGVFMDNMKTTPVFLWLDEFILDLNDGEVPVFELCFGTIAGIDFGCYNLQAEAYIWSAIKASMILFAVIVSRRIVFGG